ncbi:MAG: right-handed parallel beta-helix repeat-containing protein [Planctomycetales bacterium]|nr:right-handed parallel beta-helix repeat-containing protein [Planctomycetales bacterium]
MSKEFKGVRLIFQVATLFTGIIAPPYELSARDIVVDQSHPSATDANEGTSQRPLRTINRGAELARPGDRVIVTTGVYRERVAPARSGTSAAPIQYEAAPGAVVVIKGSEQWHPEWRRVSDQKPLYRGALDPSLFAGERIHPFRTPLKKTPDGVQRTLGQVFVDTRQFREVDSISELTATPGSWLVVAGGLELILHFADPDKLPDECQIEVTVRDRIFAPHQRGLSYIQVRGFTMEHCANQFPDRFWESDSPQAGALSCRAGHHWVIEANTIRFANSIGIDCGYEGRHDLEGHQPTPQNTGYHRIRQNIVTDNGCCGIAGMRSIGTHIVENVVERNNANQHQAPEAAGIKVHYFVDGVIERNLVRDNEAYGIWLDNVYRNARVSRNLVVNNRGSAICVELGDGPLQVDHNILANTRMSLGIYDPRGDGLYTHDASGVTFLHNLVFGSPRFGSCHLKKTKRPRAGTSRIDVRGNIFLHNTVGHVNIPYPGPDAQDNRVSENLFSSDGTFLVNPWGGVPRDELFALVTKKIGTRPPLWNQAAPQLSFAQWQRVMPPLFWTNHEIERAQATLTSDLVLTLNVDHMAQRSGATPATLITDYLGSPVPPRDAQVGPFQSLSAGHNKLRLWPITSSVANE